MREPQRLLPKIGSQEGDSEVAVDDLVGGREPLAAIFQRPQTTDPTALH